MLRFANEGCTSIIVVRLPSFRMDVGEGRDRERGTSSTNRARDGSGA